MIRKADSSDLSQLHALGNSVHEFSVNEQTVNFWPKEILANALTSKDVIILVAEDKGIICGFIIAAHVEGLKKAIIENVLVLPDARGKGIGQELVKTLLLDLKRRRCEYVTTLIPLQATAASRLYKAAGFSEGEIFKWFDLSLTDKFKRD